MTIRLDLTLDDLARERVALATPGRTLGTLEFDNDEDYFLFNPEQNRVYSIRVDSNADTEIGLFSTPDLALLLDDDDSGLGLAPEIVFETPAQPLTVLIEVDTALSLEPDGGGGFPGEIAPYALVITRLESTGPLPPAGVDVIGDTRETAAGIVAGEAIVEEIETPDDLDAFTVWLEADRAYRIAAAGLDGFDPFLRLFDPADPGGPLLGIDDNSGANGRDAEILFRAPVSDFYTFDVSGADFATDTGLYEVTVGDLGALLPVGAPDRAPDAVTAGERPLIEAGQIVAGRIDTAADIDLFEIDLLPGARYSFTALGYGGLDARIAVLDTAGALIRGDDNGLDGINPTLTFTPAVGGTYLVEVSASFAAPATQGDFDLLTRLEAPRNIFPSQARDVALLYEAGLDRDPDFDGLNFWIDVFEGDRVDGQGRPLPPVSLHGISEAFLVSDEFETNVGVVGVISDFALVTALYENVLDRAADDEGREFWLSVLARPEVDEADLLIAFARSPENIRNNPEIEDIALVDAEFGVWDFV